MSDTSSLRYTINAGHSIFKLLLLSSLLLQSFAVFADRVVLRLYEEEVREGLRRANPSWSDGQLNAAMKYEYPTRAELLKEVPESAVRERNGRLEVLGRVRQIIPGLRQGNLMDPLQYDKLVLETGLDGNGKTIVFSGFNVSHTHSSIDSAEDFSWLLSNRHELANVAPGSATHQQLFYTLVDSDGWLGLVEQPRHVVSDGIVEGSYTNFLQKGRVTQSELIATSNLRSAEQFWLGAAAPQVYQLDYQRNSADLLGQFREWLDNFVWAAAKSRKYPGYPEGFYQDVLNSLDMICGLRFADPVLVDGMASQVAWRAREMGHGCFTEVLSVLHPLAAELANEHDPDRPVTSDEIAKASLDLIENSPYFREVVLVLPAGYEFSFPELSPLPEYAPLSIPEIAPPPGMSPRRSVPPSAPVEAPPPWGDAKPIGDLELQPGWDSVEVARALIRYSTDPENPAELRQQALRIMRNWIRFDSPESEDNARYWRELIRTNIDTTEIAVGQFPPQLEVLKLLCEEGWGRPVDMEHSIERAESIARGTFVDDPPVSRAYLNWLSLVRQTGGNQGEQGNYLAELVDKQFHGPGLTHEYRTFYKMWMETRARPMNCDAIMQIDIL